MHQHWLYSQQHPVIMRFLILCLFSIIHFSGIGQFNPPAIGFGNPLDIPLILAGTFGELRSNHFHSGLDIKTQQREGLPVYAVQDGSISRIKIEHWGYGKVLYIEHSDGYSSVYGHLQKFSPEIEKYMRELQYKNRSYEIETFPKYGEITVKKGDLIAYSGNTGGSAGPHLHFEIRKSGGTTPINPLLFEYDITDNTPPTLERLFAYPLTSDAVVNKSEIQIEIPISRQPDGSFLAEPVTAMGEIGFGISTFDRLDMAINKNGVFKIEQRVNGKISSEISFDSFSFSETRQLNALIDYQYYSKHGSRIQKCFRDAGNQLSLFKDYENDGKIVVEENDSYSVELRIKDVAGNLTRLVIPIFGKSEEPMVKFSENITPFKVRSDQPATFSQGNSTVFFPAGTFYKTEYLNLSNQGDTLFLHEPRIPVSKNFTVSFSISDLPQERRKGIAIARIDSRNNLQFYKTFQRGSSLSIRSRELGTYTIAQDTIAPVIKPKNFKPKQWLNNYRYLSVIIDDKQSGIDSYNAFINGKWILMEYEPKKNTLTYTFDEKIGPGPQYDLKIEVTDAVGNATTYETTFFKS